MNIIRTAGLIAFLTALFMAVGYLIGGTGGMIIAFIVACCMNIFSWWNSDKMVLRMQGAEEVFEDNYPQYYNLVAELAERAALPMPKVYVMHSEQPNAFATGRSPENAAVAASSGLLNMLKHEEVAGVIAHELAHIKNRDTLTMTISASIAGAISMLANFAFFFGGRREGGVGIIGRIAIMFLAPFAASIVQMAISRTREYSADLLGSHICGNPMALASALNKISTGVEQHRMPAVERNHATAHMFIVNPLLARQGDSLFSTHPSTENRIAALEILAKKMHQEEMSGGDKLGRHTTQARNQDDYRDEDDAPSKKAGPWGERNNDQRGAETKNTDGGSWGKRETQSPSRRKSDKPNSWGTRAPDVKSNDTPKTSTQANNKKPDPWGKRPSAEPNAPTNAPRRRAKKTLKNPVWGRRSDKTADEENSAPTKKSSGTKARSSVTRKKSGKDNNPWD